MISLLASIDNPGALEIGGFLVLLGCVLALFKQFSGAKKELIAEIKTHLAAEALPAREQAMGPQPFKVVPEPEFVVAASFHKHAELNRGEHSRIEKEFRDCVLRIEGKIEGLGREVSEVKALRESNAQQLGVISSQVAEMSQDVGEVKGVVHQLNRDNHHGGGKRS